MPEPVQASVYTFRDIITSGYVYVDKTRYIYEIVRFKKGVYFLSRPRRFGKSLLLSTLDELFRGSRELFSGLWIDSSDYDWESYPVVRIDFSRYQAQSAGEFKSVFQLYLKQLAREYEIELPDAPFDVLFGELILRLAKRGQVVLLIDEYDRPIARLHFTAEAQRAQRKRGEIQKKTSANLRVPRVSAVNV